MNDLIKEVSIRAGEVQLSGTLTVPGNCRGAIVFAHGSGSSRFSSRNQFVAAELNDAGWATLLFDLLRPVEDEVYENRFDIPLLAKRLEAAVSWAQAEPELSDLPIGLFGASTGAAAALIAAAHVGTPSIFAVVSRGGRPDLAAPDLGAVHSPTLLIVGGEDYEVIRLNKVAYESLPVETEKKLEIIPEANHLFEEPGALEKVADLAVSWFGAHARPLRIARGYR